ncbi:MAG TPA: PHP domain-containing protein [Candidatus Nanoarchaeia archaeon]|nr:PHP domain-containing protein [Candidatus Nanoarchaeia archaeon]
MIQMIDLQSHTYMSDGEQSPEELVDDAIKRGLKAIAITDHDVVDGVQRALNHAHGKIEVVSGIEIRCYEPEKGFKEIDVLGLLVNHKNSELIALTEKGKKERISQKRKMIEKLQKMSFAITFDEVAATVKGAFGRPHIAKFLLKKYPEKFKSVQDVFDACIGYGKQAYVPRDENLPMKEAVRVIHAAGGISILAHPRIYDTEDSLRLIQLFKEADGDGIETYYPYHLVFPQLNLDEKGNMELIKFYQGIAQKNKLLESGGCDHHGAKRNTLAALKIPMEILDKMKAARVRISTAESNSLLS